MFGKIKIQGVKIKMRDYPSDILHLFEIRIETHALQIVKLFGEQMLYMRGKCELGKLEACLSLSQLSGVNELLRRFKPYHKILQKLSGGRKASRRSPSSSWVSKLLDKC